MPRRAVGLEEREVRLDRRRERAAAASRTSARERRRPRARSGEKPGRQGRGIRIETEAEDGAGRSADRPASRSRIRHGAVEPDE